MPGSSDWKSQRRLSASSRLGCLTNNNTSSPCAAVWSANPSTPLALHSRGRPTPSRPTPPSLCMACPPQTAATNEPYQVLRCGLQLPRSGAAVTAVEPAEEGDAARGGGPEGPVQPLVLLEVGCMVCVGWVRRGALTTREEQSENYCLWLCRAEPCR